MGNIWIGVLAMCYSMEVTHPVTNCSRQCSGLTVVSNYCDHFGLIKDFGIIGRHRPKWILEVDQRSLYPYLFHPHETTPLDKNFGSKHQTQGPICRGRLEGLNPPASLFRLPFFYRLADPPPGVGLTPKMVHQCITHHRPQQLIHSWYIKILVSSIG